MSERALRDEIERLSVELAGLQLRPEAQSEEALRSQVEGVRLEIQALTEAGEQLRSQRDVVKKQQHEHETRARQLRSRLKRVRAKIAVLQPPPPPNPRAGQWDDPDAVYGPFGGKGCLALLLVGVMSLTATRVAAVFF